MWPPRPPRPPAASFAQAFCAARLSADDCDAVRGALPRESRAQVHKASKACGPLYDWTDAQLAHARALQQAAPLRQEAERLEAELTAAQAAGAAAAADLRTAEAIVAALDAERRALEPEVAQAAADCEAAAERTSTTACKGEGTIG